jgi:iron(III) transport system substrate-binding protein
MNQGPKRMTALLACGGLALALVGCSRSSDADTDGGKTETFENGTATSITPELVKKADAEGTVTVQYAASLESMTAIVAAFNDEYPDIEVVLERDSGASGGASMLQEFQADEDRVDVFGGSDVPTSLALADAGAIENLVPDDASKYPEAFRLAPGMYSTTASTLVVGFNTDEISPDNAAELSDWEHVAEQADNGKVAISTPATSTGGMMLYYGWKNFGDEWLQGLADLDPKLYDDTAVGRDALVSGQASLALGQQEATLLQLVQQGAPVAYVYPDPAPQFLGNIYGVLTNAPHPNAARLFWAWMTSEKGCLSQQAPPANQRCPMEGVGEMPGLPTDASWYQPLDNVWLADDTDWTEGLTSLNDAMSSTLGTP